MSNEPNTNNKRAGEAITKEEDKKTKTDSPSDRGLDLAALLKAHSDQDSEVIKLESELKSAKERREVSKAQIQTQIQDAIKKAKEKKNSELSEIRDLSCQIRSLQSKRGKKRAECEDLEKLRNALEAFETKGQSLKEGEITALAKLLEADE
jgi:chromosome segregation ATPase